MVLIGYSGHGLVAAGILKLMGKPVTDYCDNKKKKKNPLKINYLGKETDAKIKCNLITNEFFISIGDNRIRKNVAEKMKKYSLFPLTIKHPSAIIDVTSKISQKGVMICAGVVVNAFASIDDGVILNTSSVIEHECIIHSYAHIGPGAVLCGNVTIGESSFVGARAVIKQNITIGKNATIGAGAVVVKDVPDNDCIVGNPGKKLIK